MYLHEPALRPSTWYRVDTASGSNTPTTVYAHDAGADPIGTVVGASGSTVRASTTQNMGHFWSATLTLYCKELDWLGAPTGTVVTSAGRDLTPVPAADPSGSYVPAVVMPAGTGVAATDAANFAAALAKVPATGGVIQLLPTTATAYDFTSGVTIDRPVTLRGWGGSNGPLSAAAGNSATYLTRITSSSATGTAITVTSDGCTFEDFALVNTATPTAGAGIAVTAGGAATRYRGVTVGGFYRCFDHQAGHEWFMDGCVAYDFVKTGLRIQNPTAGGDAGDMGIVNCQFIAGPNNLAPQAGVEWCSGGGLRMVGCKVNLRGSGVLTLGLFLHPNDGVSTSVFTITGNSFEGMQYGIYSDDTGNSGTGIIGKVTISGNEFLCPSFCIAFGRANTGKLANVVITGNVLTSPSSIGGISLAKMDMVDIGANVFHPAITTKLAFLSGVTNLMLDGSFAYTTAGRPAATIMRAGSRYYDTTLSKPAWSDGTNWKDAAGTNV